MLDMDVIHSSQIAISEIMPEFWNPSDHGYIQLCDDQVTVNITGNAQVIN